MKWLVFKGLFALLHHLNTFSWLVVHFFLHRPKRNEPKKNPRPNNASPLRACAHPAVGPGLRTSIPIIQCHKVIKLLVRAYAKGIYSDVAPKLR